MTERTALRAEPARRDVVVRARDAISSIKCDSRWDDHGEPVCRRHGFAWPQDRDLCNYYSAALMEALTILAELTLAHSHERAAHRALLVRLGDLAEWHDTKAMKARRFPGGPKRVPIMEKAAQVHTEAAKLLRELGARPPHPDDVPPAPQGRAAARLAAFMGRNGRA